MKEGVYYYQVDTETVKQLIFIQLTNIGSVQNRPVYRCEQITFSFADICKVFPHLNTKKYSAELLSSMTPLTVSFYSRELEEGSSMYEYYSSKAKECSIIFRVIEHLYENYKSLSSTVTQLLDVIAAK